jgi:hypothetical protein
VDLGKQFVLRRQNFPWTSLLFRSFQQNTSRNKSNLLYKNTELDQKQKIETEKCQDGRKQSNKFAQKFLLFDEKRHKIKSKFEKKFYREIIICLFSMKNIALILGLKFDFRTKLFF